MVFEDVGKLSKIIDAIHAADFGCAMDDFGSGYASLNLIQNIPVDTIRLDKVFFRNGTLDIKHTESVGGSILAMSRSLDMTTVAEGVEERVQVDMLKRLGCDYIQGYYFAKPIPDFERLAFGAALKDDPNEAIMLGIRIIFCLFLLALSSACERPDSAEPVVMCLPSHPLQRQNPGNRAR